MTLQEIIDTVQKRHPGTSGVYVTRLVNRALKDYCFKTEILETQFTLDGGTVQEKRWYDLPEQILKVKSVDVEDNYAPMLVGRPEKRDTT